ncbi:hypothetical protein AAFC00_001811 [Neodothiora populina]
MHALNESTPEISRNRDVKRWDPQRRTCSPWDGLRRDEELYQSGDCAVHLYTEGRSKRGPSFQLSSADIVAVGCSWMMGVYSGQQQDQRTSKELYIPAPVDKPRSGTFRWHLATRNFFAWIMSRPLVGMDLGDSLIDLLDRMHLFRPHADNLEDLFQYAKRVGYLNLVGCPEYALAFLRLAEHCQCRHLWINAFTHCVGMNDHLTDAPGFDRVTQVTKALIARAYLEMDLHLGRVTRALKVFLEDELSPSHFGLSSGAQDHLDRFRSFLNRFYIRRFGFWPPEQGPVFSKPLLQRMKNELQSLHDLLVDQESSDSLEDLFRPASGGICVRQNISAFNYRHGYEPLPNPLPLLPEHQGSPGRTDSQRGLRSFKLGSKASGFVKGMTARTAIAMATNSAPADIRNCKLVQEYISFEGEWSAKPVDKVSIADARKVRWIVIYCMLQMLHSVTRAPEEVSDPVATPYHICVLTHGTPPWGPDAPQCRSVESQDAPAPSSRRQSACLIDFISDNGAFSLGIQPDCERDDFVPKRTPSQASLRPAALRINTNPITRSLSVRSFSKRSSPTRRSSTGGRPVSAFVSRPANESPMDGYLGRLGSSIVFQEPTQSALHTLDDTPDQAMQAQQPARYPAPLRLSSSAIASISDDSPTPTLGVSAFDDLHDAISPPSSVQSSSRPPSLFSSPASTSNGFWQFDDADTSSWTSGDDRRRSREVHSMDHDSVYASSPTMAGKSFVPPSRRSSSGLFFSSDSSASSASFSAAATAGSAHSPSSSWSSQQQQPTLFKQEAPSPIKHQQQPTGAKSDNDELVFEAQNDIHRALDLLSYTSSGGTSHVL